MTSGKDTLPPPDKTVSYAIGEDEEGGALFLYGSPEATKIAIMCPGYPDDHSAFQPFASRLSKEGNCLVGVMCLPGYDDRPERPWTGHKKDGYTFDEMVACIRNAVKALRAESKIEDAELTGIFFDWGTIPGTFWSRRTLEEGVAGLKPDKMVYFDVLPETDPKAEGVPDIPGPSKISTMITMVYRVLNAQAFLLQRYVSKYFALFWWILGTMMLNIFRLNPVKDIDMKVFEKHPKSMFRMMYMAYPYWKMFAWWFEEPSFYLPKDLATTPVLYMYGIEKNFQFHSEKPLKWIQQKENEGGKSKVIAVEDAGHFLFLQKPDICLEAVNSFINDS